MLLIGLILVCVLTSGVDGKTCTECTTQYGSTKTCDKIKEYLACLETAIDANDVLCVLATDDAAAIKTDWEALTAGSCPLTKACECQYDFFRTDLNPAAPAHCNTIKARITCLKTQTDLGCDGTATVSTLAGNSETRAGKITGTVCTIEKSCDCELSYAKADIGDAAKKCTAAATFVDCLVGKTDTGCMAANTISALATAADTTITDLGSDCVKTDVCECEITYAKTRDVGSNPLKCGAAKTFSGCITKSVKDGCSGMKMDLGTTVSAAITTLGTTDCTVTSVCTCELNFNRMDVSDDKKCDSSKAYTTCLDGITDTTIKGCDDTSTTATLKTDHEKLELCTESGMKPLMASLAVVFISVFVSMF